MTSRASLKASETMVRACPIALLLAIACLPIRTAQPTSSARLLDRDIKTRRLPGQILRADLVAPSGLSPDGKFLELGVELSRVTNCEVITTSTYEVTTTTRRTSDAGFMAAVSVIPAAMFAAGTISLASGNSFSEGAPNQKKLTLTGFALMLGSPGVLGMAAAGIAALGSIDSSESNDNIGTQRKVVVCQKVPVRGTELIFKADSHAVHTGATDARARIRFDLHRQELAEPPRRLSFSVGNAAVNASPELQILLHLAIKRWHPSNSHAPNSTAQAASPGASPSPSEPLPAPDDPQTPSGVRLFGEAFVTAKQERFEAAVVQAGCKLERREGQHKAWFDISCLELSGFKRMKVLYDGDLRLVSVKYVGARAEDDRKRMLDLLTAEYGAPTIDGSSRSATWSPGDGVVLELKPEFFEHVLVFTNTAALAALKSEVERSEQEKLQLLRKKRGTAF